ncbi:Chemotaxis protein cheD [Bradyrhizobium sp. ORS 278]|uniref:chemoreceptor glutamine deamidase CheD n=1 Tax=Bradyrhizobium sp. (strain ORS 278) TaxID=114615 RepID=UPI0001507B78|nr:chemoreceptor glutamine deamidase CheD [Bradyrhizobium sp. ORS 278]CAL75698.1 Chemotaxis protein cheD [Bradyrhizobium sp. ORS 278]
MIKTRTGRRATTATPPTEEIVTGSRRYRDKRFDAVVVKVFPGEHYVTDKEDEMLVTVLGSCVAACIRDPKTGVGGMNHFMLPENFSHWGNASDSMRYGNVAMERLINDVLIRGGARRRLEIKVFGGANVLNGVAKIGHRNADFVEEYLAAENLPIAASHLRGSLPRRVHYFPATGRVMLLELPRADHEALVRHETSYKSKIQVEPVAGSIELF